MPNASSPSPGSQTGTTSEDPTRWQHLHDRPNHAIAVCLDGPNHAIAVCLDGPNHAIAVCLDRPNHAVVAVCLNRDRADFEVAVHESTGLVGLCSYGLKVLAPV